MMSDFIDRSLLFVFWSFEMHVTRRGKIHIEKHIEECWFLYWIFRTPRHCFCVWKRLLDCVLEKKGLLNGSCPLQMTRLHQNFLLEYLSQVFDEWSRLIRKWSQELTEEETNVWTWKWCSTSLIGKIKPRSATVSYFSH